MRKFGWICVLLTVAVVQGFSQTTFVAVNPGAWADGATWGNTSPGVQGVDYPGALDDAFTNRQSITVSGLVTCKNLAVSYDHPNSISGSGVIEITGTMAGYADDFGLPAAPVVNVFGGTLPLFRFTALNYDGINPFSILISGEVLGFWNSMAPFNAVSFQLAQDAVVDGGDIIFAGPDELRFGVLTVSGGTAGNPRQLQTGFNLTAIRATSLVIGANTTLISEVPISGTATPIHTARLTSAAISGTLRTSSYLNTGAITIGATGTLETSFNGANQTQGWWHTTTNPTGAVTLTAGSTVNFNFEGSQAVPTRVYSNLILDGSGTKTLNGVTAFTVSNLSILTDVTLTSLVATARNISGNLIVDGTWQPSLPVFFNGTGTQSISGGGTLVFNGGISKTAASTLTFNKALSTSGITHAAGSLNLGNFTTTLISGNFSMTGTVTSGTTGTLVISTSSTLSGAGALTLNNLTINGTAVINNSSWSITGNITNSGTLTLPANSTITFTGGASQSLTGNAISVGNITVNKTSSTVSVNSNIELLGTLTMTTGTFDADGSGSGIFTLNSDTNGDARIGVMAGGSITGELTFERYFENTSNRWRNLAFPVSSVTHTELQSSFPVHTNSLSYYVEATAGDVNQGWTYVNSGTLPNGPTTGRGFSAWMYNLGPTTVSVRGPLLKNTPANGGSPYNFSVTYTNNVPGAPDVHDGWNFIPNPFASAIDWDNSGWVKTNVNGAAAIWDIEANMYRYTDAGWDGVIASGQAFWVQTNAASPVLTCQEAVKVSDSDPIFYRQAAVEDKLLVKLKSAVLEDIAAIRFREDATPEFDTEYDASKLSNPVFNLSSLTRGGLSLAVNNLPKGPCASTVFLNITNIEPGTYTLSFEGLNTFNDLESITLLDHFVNTKTLLTDKNSFVFDVSSDAASFGSSRFELAFNFVQSAVEPLTISREGDRLLSNYTEGSYQWLLNGVAIENATGPSYQPATNGAYKLELVYKGCVMHSENITVEGMSRVFPNPVSGDLQIHVADLIPTGVNSGKILITSPVGASIKEISFSKDDLIKIIDMRGVRPGQYIVSISTQEKIIERVKIVVQ